VKEIPISISDALEPAQILLDHVNSLSANYKDFNPSNTRCTVLELDFVMDALVRLLPLTILVDPQVDNQIADDTKIT
jgi:hypothetical protein